MTTEDIRICFLGDSFVNGTGDETTLGWAGRLCAAANASGTPITYYNLGIRGNTSRDILHRWERESALRLPESCDGRLVISCGVNDTAIALGQVRVSPEESCANLQAILRSAKQKYRVLIVGPPPVEEGDRNTRIEAISAAYAREAESQGIPYIELYSHLVTDEAYRREVAANDGSHPRSQGYQTMARIIGTSQSWWFDFS